MSFPLLVVILGYIALTRNKQAGHKGRSLTLAGLIVGLVLADTTIRLNSASSGALSVLLVLVGLVRSRIQSRSGLI